MTGIGEGVMRKTEQIRVRPIRGDDAAVDGST
jgi:hypothetical protein